MSQHYFRPVPNTVILMGWDRPLQGYFCVIECGDELLYSNLEDPILDERGGMSGSLDYLLDCVVARGLNVPQEMIAEIKADAAHNIGNREMRWNELSEGVM